MRSVFFTFVLILLALVSGGLTAVRLSEGSLARIFGAPPIDIGGHLYEFDPGLVKDITLRGNSIEAACQRTEQGWMMVSPWEDRMDPRIAQSLLNFTLESRVEGAIPTEKIESSTLGFDDGLIGVRIRDADQEPLAKYILGRRTSWLGTDPETNLTVPTIFVEPKDRSRKDYTYACTDPEGIHSLLNDGFKRLRDHHPFLFHPNIVQSLRIRNRSGELLLSRSQPKELWRIVKPLELKSDRDSLTRLVQGIYNLEAVKVMSRSEVTLPTDDPTEVDQIAIRFFGREDEIVLEIYPPETPDSPTVLARVSDRPNAVFELLRKPQPVVADAPGPVASAPLALSELPLSVNELRDPTLTSINPAQVQGILIASASSENIFIKRDDPQDHFKVQLDGKFSTPNETALFSLLKTITEGKVAGFVSDTATDLAPYGLDHPFMSLRFLGFDDSFIQLDFSQNKDGEILAMRAGTTTVVKIDPVMLSLIPLNPWEWRDTRLWSISDNDVNAIERRLRGTKPLTLGYKGITEQWSANQDGKDRTPELAIDRANRFLDHLTGLEVGSWIRPDNEQARKALADPDMVITLIAKDFNEVTGIEEIKQHKLTIGSIEVDTGRVYYGSIDGMSNPFIVKMESFELLSVDLFNFE